jgi:hypothetical protein
LVEAFKEHQAHIEKMKKEIEALKKIISLRISKRAGHKLTLFYLYQK